MHLITPIVLLLYAAPTSFKSDVNNECLASSHLCEKTSNSPYLDVASSAPNSYECNEDVEGRRTCPEVSTFRISMLVLAVNGDNASSLGSANNKENSEVFNLFCSFFQDYFGDANMMSCSVLAVERKDFNLKVALLMDIVSNSRSFKAHTLEFAFISVSTLDHNSALMWEKSNGDSIVVALSSFDVELTDHITCSFLECFNDGMCVFDETFYEIFCRCHEEFEGHHCEYKKEEKTDHDKQYNSLTVDLVMISGSLAFLLTLCRRKKHRPVPEGTDQEDQTLMTNA